MRRLSFVLAMPGRAEPGVRPSRAMPLGFQRRGEHEAVLPKGGTTIAQPFKVGSERPENRSVPKGTADFNPKGIARRIGYDVSSVKR